MHQQPNQEEFQGQIFEPEQPIQDTVLARSEEETLFSRENKTIHWIKICLFVLFGLYIAILSAVLLWHILTPVSLRWLTKEEISTLQSMFVTGIGAALLGKFGNKLADFK